MSKINIEEKLKQVYAYLKDYTNENGFPPSVREICKELSIKSTATAYYYLEKLKKRGLINKPAQKKRALGIINKEKPDSVAVPYVGKVTAGSPILAVESLEEYIAVPTAIFNSNDEMFILNVKGESMINAGILNNDKIIVNKQNTAQNGEIVVALIDDLATVKRFYKKKDKIILHPENETMEDIVLDDVIILGKVTGLIRKY